MLNDMLLGTTGVLLQVQAQVDTDSTVDDNTIWEGWGSVIFVLTIVSLVALVVALLIWQLFRTRQVRTAAEVTIAQEAAYQKLAEQSADAQTRTAEELALLRESVTDLRTRVTTIERMLAEVG